MIGSAARRPNGQRLIGTITYEKESRKIVLVARYHGKPGQGDAIETALKQIAPLVKEWEPGLPSTADACGAALLGAERPSIISARRMRREGQERRDRGI